MPKDNQMQKHNTPTVKEPFPRNAKLLRNVYFSLLKWLIQVLIWLQVVN